MNPLYQFDDIQFAYVKKPVLDIEHLEITGNNVTALLGNNGAGKSTLLKLLAFLEFPQQGVIRFCGEKVRRNSLHSLRKKVVLVEQKPYLLRGTVIENVLLGLKFRGIAIKLAKEQAIGALEQVGISSFSNKPVAELSGGEAQKVALARALALKPETLLLDEPFSHLDQKSINQLSHLVSDFSRLQGKTVIFSTHNQLHATTLANETICLLSGQCVETDLSVHN